MESLDVEVRGPKDRGRGWAVETITCGYCGVRNTHVYPAHLEQIECDCGHWIMTALGNRRANAERSN